MSLIGRDALILNLKENPAHDGGNNHSFSFALRSVLNHQVDLIWKTMDKTKIIPVNPDEPLDLSLFDTIPVCMVATVTRNGGVVALLVQLHVTRNRGSVASRK